MKSKFAPFLALLAATLMPPAAMSAEVVRQPAVPLDVRVPAAPAWIPAHDGAHALYELHLANYRSLPLELLRLDILDEADGSLLAGVDGEVLLQILARPGVNLAPDAARIIDGGQVRISQRYAIDFIQIGDNGLLAVRVGDRVRRGDVLGRLGNSGNSDAPHLHLHVTDLAAPLGAEGRPFVFEEFARRGHIDDIDAWLESRKPWVAGMTPGEPRRGELPLNGDVVDFPGGASP